MKTFAIGLAMLLSGATYAASLDTSELPWDSNPAVASADVQASPPYRWLCLARGGRPHYQPFRGYGFSRPDAARRAIVRCRQYSYFPRSCRIDFCRPIRRF